MQRWVKFCKYLPSLGWQPVVYTPLNPDLELRDETLGEEIPACAEILKTPIKEPYALYKKIFRKGKRGWQEVNPISASSGGLKSRIARFLRGNLFIPDPRVSWVGPSVRFLKKYLREHPVDVIVSTGPPHSMHLTGLRLHRATSIPWVADFRDPWTEMFYFKHLSLTPCALRKHRTLEKAVLDGASAVVAVSPRVRRDFEAATSTRVELITNGFDPEDFPAPTESGRAGRGKSPDKGDFTIVHTGLFAADGNPTVLWDVLKEKCREEESFKKSLRIILAGKTDSAVKEAIVSAGLGENLSDRGYLPHNETVRLQTEASMLILPLRREKEYSKVLPGKIFEYIASRRPVLGIGVEDSAASDVLADSGAGAMFDWEDRAAQAGFVERIWQKHLAGTAAKDIEKYSRPELAKKMAALFDSLI